MYGILVMEHVYLKKKNNNNDSFVYGIILTLHFLNYVGCSSRCFECVLLFILKVIFMRMLFTFSVCI